MKKIIAITLSLVLALSLFVGCSPKTDDKTIVIAASPTPHAEILEIAKEEILCADQYDYVLINDTVEDTVRRLGQIIHGNRYSRSSMKGFLKSYVESEIKSELVDMIRSL